jgi:hypothetical protein
MLATGNTMIYDAEQDKLIGAPPRGGNNPPVNKEGRPLERATRDVLTTCFTPYNARRDRFVDSSDIAPYERG